MTILNDVKPYGKLSFFASLFKCNKKPTGYVMLGIILPDHNPKGEEN